MVSVPDSLAGKVVTVTGEVTADSDAGSRILSVDSPVYQDETLVTEHGEHAEVLFSDGTRLSIGENSSISIDSYVFDPDAPEASAILLDAVQGTFRTITGEITEQNPENFTIKTPLATLGIRGTTVLSYITPDHEFHGPEFIEEGKTFVLTDNFGNIRFITDYVPIKVIDVRPDEPAGFQRILTQDEFMFFQEQVPMTFLESDETDMAAQAAASDTDTDHGMPTLFGHDSDETPSLLNLARVADLFGPEGLSSRFGDFSTHYEKPSFSEPADHYKGFIEDSTNHNTPPVAHGAEGEILEDHSYFGTFDATDIDGDDLTYSILDGPDHGTVEINPTSGSTAAVNDTHVNANGSSGATFVYTPDANYHGTDSFTYLVTDSAGNTDSAEVDIIIHSVNDDPVASDSTFNTAVDTPVNGQLHAYDVDGDHLHYSIGTDPSNGTLTLNPDGSFTYTPDAGFSGSDGFEFWVDDGHGGHDIGHITFTIGAGPPPGPGNTAPVATNLNLTGTQGLVVVDQVTATDADGDPITYSVLTPPTMGTLFLNPDGTFDYSTSNAAGVAEYGTDTFQFLADDGQGGQGIGTVTITVAADYFGTGGNDAPPAGTALSDVFDGLGGNDTFDGAGGNDFFIGGTGADTLTGGAGSDTFSYTQEADGGDTITDFDNTADVIEILTAGFTIAPTTVVIGTGSVGYSGLGFGTGPGIIIFNNTISNTWQVFYDPDLQTTGSPHTLLADLGSNPIDVGDISLV